jgi:hypothetical protein
MGADDASARFLAPASFDPADSGRGHSWLAVPREIHIQYRDRRLSSGALCMVNTRVAMHIQVVMELHDS